MNVPQIKTGPKRNVGHVTYGTPFWPTFAFLVSRPGGQSAHRIWNL